MSHTVRLNCIFKDLDALAAAVNAIPGLLWRQGQTDFKSFTTGQCLHAIRVADNPQAYEAGIVARQDGKGYDVMLDQWQGGFGLCEKIGQQAEKLRAAYGLEMAKREALRAGFSVRQLISAHGKPMLELRKNVDW